jgi:hypothetical protein
MRSRASSGTTLIAVPVPRIPSGGLLQTAEHRPVVQAVADGDEVVDHRTAGTRGAVAVSDATHAGEHDVRTVPGAGVATVQLGSVLDVDDDLVQLQFGGGPVRFGENAPPRAARSDGRPAPRTGSPGGAGCRPGTLVARPAGPVRRQVARPAVHQPARSVTVVGVTCQRWGSSYSNRTPIRPSRSMRRTHANQGSEAGALVASRKALSRSWRVKPRGVSGRGVPPVLSANPFRLDPSPVIRTTRA